MAIGRSISPRRQEPFCQSFRALFDGASSSVHDIAAKKPKKAAKRPAKKAAKPKKAAAGGRTPWALAGLGGVWGGLSAAGMMPGFGASLPVEYIQAVVDYERGL